MKKITDSKSTQYYEYKRNGVIGLIMIAEPKAGKRIVFGN